MQSKRMSIVESVVNTVVGLVVAFAAQAVVFPLYGIHVSTVANMQIVAWFTLVSILRSYILRRMFNSLKDSK